MIKLLGHWAERFVFCFFLTLVRLECVFSSLILTECCVQLVSTLVYTLWNGKPTARKWTQNRGKGKWHRGRNRVNRPSDSHPAVLAVAHSHTQRISEYTHTHKHEVIFCDTHTNTYRVVQFTFCHTQPEVSRTCVYVWESLELRCCCCNEFSAGLFDITIMLNMFDDNPSVVLLKIHFFSTPRKERIQFDDTPMHRSI